MASSITRATGEPWPLPVRDGDDWQPGDVVEPDEHGAPVLLDAAELLDELGECIFVAEAVGDAGAARLVAGTAWSERWPQSSPSTASSTSSQTVPGSAEAELPGGGTLGAIIASAREYLATGTGTDGPAPRVRLADRRRRAGSGARAPAIGDAAFTAAAQAEGEGVDILSDPAWETLAAARDAVLAAVEAVRHVAFPFLVERETRRYEAHEERKDGRTSTRWTRPGAGSRSAAADPKYAPVLGGGTRRGRALPPGGGRPERCRRGRAERSWQVGRLVELLGAE